MIVSSYIRAIVCNVEDEENLCVEYISILDDHGANII